LSREAKNSKERVNNKEEENLERIKYETVEALSFMYLAVIIIKEGANWLLHPRRR
jgi:hypothetical protein